MMYFEFENEAKAERVSRLLFSLFSPDSATSVYLFGWYAHPTEPKVMAFVQDDEQPVHHNDNLDSILDQIAQELGSVSNQAELTALGQYIRNNDKIYIRNIIPQYFKDNEKTVEDLTILGYFKPL